MIRQPKYHYILSEKGFTFIEVLLYMAILSIVLVSLVLFGWNIIESGAKSATQQLVYSNARFISEQIKYQIRNASGINALSATQVSLISSTSANNPTIISLASGNITMKQGANSAINLNTQNASVSSLLFKNYSSSDNKTKNIQFSFTLNASNSAGTRQEFNASTTIESDAEIRSN